MDRELFDALRVVRLEIAKERGVPPFTILHDTTLRDLARYRPTTLDGLQQLRGFGQRKLADFGARLLACIRESCQARGLACDLQDSEPPPRPRPVQTNTRLAQKRQSVACTSFGRGRPIAQVARDLGLKESTVWGYFERYVEEQAPADISPWVDPPTYKLIVSALAACGESARANGEPERLKPVFERLGEKIPYEIIRVVATHRAAHDPSRERERA